MIYIQTEYSFKKSFYPLEQAVADAKEFTDSVCIIDDTTFGYVKFEKACNEAQIVPYYGLSIMVTDISKKDRSVHKTCNTSERMILIAISTKGITDLYDLYRISTERYNRYNRLLPSDLIGRDIVVIGDVFPSTYSRIALDIKPALYPSLDDISVYQCITGARGIDPTPNCFTGKISAGFDEIGHVQLPRATMIKYSGPLDFTEECKIGLENLGLSSNNEYLDRMAYEIKMIKSKNFQDYFMIVSDMIKEAKKSMIVGPGRGSSGGSLVCYALGITSVDPIEHGLIFERFIDVNRSDYPDIDTDYPDTRRADVIAQTARRHQSVHKLSTITRYSPRSILNDFAKEYDIPAYELSDIKNSIIERSSGDARAKSCLGDTFEGEAGKAFLDKYPYMRESEKAEGHARNFGTHAAGIIVLDEPMSNYGAVDEKTGVVCLEGKDAEEIGLLKIDCLGLRTLSIIENCLKLSGIPLAAIYKIPLDDEEVLNVFNGGDLSDIFQFDGAAIGMVCNRITVDSFNDLVAITALGRPGALNSGGTDNYIKVNEGEQPPEYFGDDYYDITKDTNGVVVYQEQTMLLLRAVGSLSWEDVNIMRRIISKSRGDQFFAKYKDKFIDGALLNGYEQSKAEEIWEAIAPMGSYAFNKSHAVAYAMISYWCAYCKVSQPFNFLAANLNNAKDDDHALTLLRKYVKSHDIEYVTVDPDISMVGWTIQDGVLVGGLTNIKGIGEKKALDIIERRKPGSKKKFTATMLKTLMNPVTPFDELYPIETTYAHIYKEYNITKIEDIKPGDRITTIGKLLVKDLRDRNDVQSLIKRDGKRIETNTHYLNLTIEDDTGVIKGTIAPFDMDKLNGLELAETLVVGEVIGISGSVREGWSTIGIKGVRDVKDIQVCE